ncbi:tyrosine-type recombinase/integrase [Pedobacter faecalis]|uniref:tyrosine-type recombinase/integrase n=1 Tax=Pedobacter faecalis TaxID=3041495 RepID=UPI002550E7F0|nr:tyrosine-type recombinase/integrase [Pedobacter sp. ELA7]
MAASVKILLYKHKTYSDGTHPVVIQVIIDRKPIKTTVAKILPDQWDPTTCRVKARKHPNAAQINLKIIEEYNRVERLVIDGSLISSNARQVLRNESMDETDTEPAKRDSVPDLIRGYAKSEFWSKNKITRYNTHMALANEIESFAGKSVFLEDINEQWLDGFFIYLETKEHKPNAASTRRKKRSWISKFLQYCQSKGLYFGNPTCKIKIVGKKPVKRKLSEEELEAFINTEKLSGHQQMCQDIFLLQFYNRGMRVGDVLALEQKNIKGDRLVYFDEKTDKHFDIRMRPEAIKILNKYKVATGRIFPIYKWYYDHSLEPQENEQARLRELKRSVCVVNNALRRITARSGIDKKITTHIARHTYSKMAFAKIKNPLITMGLLGHTSLKVHQEYIQDIMKSDELDAADDMVFGRQPTDG